MAKKKRADQHDRAAKPSLTGRRIGLALGSVAAVAILALLLWPKDRQSNQNPVTNTAERAAPALTRAFSPDAPYREIYAGVERCAQCHQDKHSGWLRSFHSRAMEAADQRSVAGDFNNARFNREGTIAEMFMQNGQYYMKAHDRDSRPGTYPVAYTFGAKHMQDYLTVMPDGRIQVLPVYYHVTGKEWVDFTTIRQGRLTTDHPFYWTNFRRTFNKECFDCHVTGMEINYDNAANRFNTSWVNLSVGCESCHGPGAAHADAPALNNIINPSRLSREAELAMCARCHGPKSPHFSIYSRRHRYFPGDNYDDHFVPLSPIDTGVEGGADFYADGRPNSSSFEYQAMIQSRCFLKSKMTCLSCHGAPHDAPNANELLAADNSMCASCHKPQTDNLTAHTKHKPEGEAALCVSCHMPKIVPGVLDKFADHSIDIPNPDNTRDYKIPNACNECHKDKTVAWASEKFRELYTDRSLIRRKVIAAAFNYAGRPEAERALHAILSNRDEAPFLRANAAALLARYGTPLTVQMLTMALGENDYLIRLRAASSLAAIADIARANERTRAALGTTLSDKNVMVRAQAANALMQFGDRRGLELFESMATSQQYSDWFRVRAVLANYYFAQGDLKRAQSELEKTLADKPDYIEALKLLAEVHLKQGNRPAAADQWKKILQFDAGNKEAKLKVSELR